MVCDTPYVGSVVTVDFVLILILLEYGLRQYTAYFYGSKEDVLILILLEYGLRLRENDNNKHCA